MFACVFLRQVALGGTVSRAFTACCGRAAGNLSACLVVVVGGWQKAREMVFLHLLIQQDYLWRQSHHPKPGAAVS